MARSNDRLRRSKLTIATNDWTIKYHTLGQKCIRTRTKAVLSEFAEWRWEIKRNIVCQRHAVLSEGISRERERESNWSGWILCTSRCEINCHRNYYSSSSSSCGTSLTNPDSEFTRTRRPHTAQRSTACQQLNEALRWHPHRLSSTTSSFRMFHHWRTKLVVHLLLAFSMVLQLDTKHIFAAQNSTRIVRFTH